MRTIATIHLGLAVVASLLLAATLLAAGERPAALDGRDLLLALTIVGLVAAAHRYTIDGDVRGRTPSDAGIIFGAVLLFEPGLVPVERLSMMSPTIVSNASGVQKKNPCSKESSTCRACGDVHCILFDTDASGPSRPLRAMYARA